MQLTLFNNYSDNCCGYCQYHQCSVTVKQMRKKECLLKQCRHLVKNTEHQIWRQRAVTAERRSKRKQSFQDMINNLTKCK